MTRFKKDYPTEDGWYYVLVRWHEGCGYSFEQYDYEVLKMVILNGALYTEEIDMVEDGVDFDILGYSSRVDTGK